MKNELELLLGYCKHHGFDDEQLEVVKNLTLNIANDHFNDGINVGFEEGFSACINLEFEI